MNEIKVVYKNISDVKPYENNPRRNDKAVAVVAESIKAYGFKVPCIITQDGVLVTGHTRYKAAKKLGIDEIPCVIADDLTEEQINEFRIADNKVGEISKWDKSKLIIETAKLPKFEPLKFGFASKDLLKRKDIGRYGDERDRTFNAYNLTMFDASRTAGKYQMPKLKKETFVPTKMLGFNYALSSEEYECCVHFFIDDDQFERVWNYPDKYYEPLFDFAAVCTPDFSLYTEMPYAMKIWNVYRSKLLGQAWQDVGLTVIPTLTWCEPETYDFCFDGIPKLGTVAISTIGVKKADSENYELFCKGLTEAIRRVKPKTILVYGGKIDYKFPPKIKVIYFKNEVTERMSENH